MPRQLDLVRRNTKNFREGVEKIWESKRESVDEAALKVARGDAVLESLAEGPVGSGYGRLEAIVLASLRPAYFISDDKIELSGSPVEEDPELVKAITDQKSQFEKVCKAVGRVDLFQHWSLEYAGTGWLIEENVAVTNRHVARFFAEKDWKDRYRFRRGRFDAMMEARVDYMQQHQTDHPRRRADVVKVLYIAGSDEADIAFLEVETHEDCEPLELLGHRASEGTPVAVVGYPAEDPERNDPELMEDLFGSEYDVKRFAPGYITGAEEGGVILKSDYTSLGGNSGSPVIDLNTGKAVALHFSGAFRDTNYAIASDIVAAARAGTKTKVALSSAEIEKPKPDPSSAAEEFVDREGYQSTFLGEGELEVHLPNLCGWATDLAEVSDDENNLLKYCHFSIYQSASRRFPLLTAVNIDGAKAIKLKRKGAWRLDDRISKDHQVGNIIYYKNPLDRGHLVRRMDPGWGDTREEAQKGETDTFHYTVCAPQHEDLNQKDWLGLEDYILESAKTRDFKVSVFTGPIFRDDDKKLRKQPGAEDIQIPEEFWKVAVMVNEDTGKLTATGYVLTQGKMIRNLTEAAFVYGEYQTYQVQIAKIEAETGLDFGKLRKADPMGAALKTEAAFTEVARVISGLESLDLGGLKHVI